MELMVHTSRENEVQTEEAIHPTVEGRLKAAIVKGSAALSRSAAALQKIEDILKFRRP